MENKKINSEALNNIYKNAHIALQSISDVLPEVCDLDLKQEMINEHDGYEKLIGELSQYMSERNIEPKDINVMKKMMLKTSIKMNTLTDDSKSHIAEMMVKGTVMGITELTEMINNSGDIVDQEVLNFADKLRNLEEQYEENLKTYL